MEDKSIKGFFSASAALSARLGINLLAQILQVPLFLTVWSAAEYGAWLAIQGVLGFAVILDAAHQSYSEGVYYAESGHTDRLRDRLRQGMTFGALVSVAQVLVAGVVLAWCSANPGHGGATAFWRDMALAALLWAVAWAFTFSPAGQVGRLLNCFDGFAQQAWFGTFYIAAGALAPLVLLVWPLSPLQFLGVNIAISVVYHWYWFRRMLPLVRQHCGSFPLYAVNGLALRTRALGALGYLTKAASEHTRQQGLRVVLAANFAAPQIAAFSTVRTIANVVQQAGSTFFGPALPGLSKSLAAGDEHGVRTVLGLLDCIAVLVAVPLLMVLQLLAPHFYMAWTRNSLPYDGLLFALASTVVLVAANYSSYMAYAISANRVKVIALTSLTSAVVLVAGLSMFVRGHGLWAVMLVLILCEGVVGVMLHFWCSAGLRDAGMRWPRRAPAARVVFSLVAVGLLLVSPDAPAPTLALLYAAFMAGAGYALYRVCPDELSLLGHIVRVPLRRWA